MNQSINQSMFHLFVSPSNSSIDMWMFAVTCFFSHDSYFHSCAISRGRMSSDSFRFCFFNVFSRRKELTKRVKQRGRKSTQKTSQRVTQKTSPKTPSQGRKRTRPLRWVTTGRAIFYRATRIPSTRRTTRPRTIRNCANWKVKSFSLIYIYFCQKKK